MNRCAPVLATGSGFALKPASGARGGATGPVRSVSRGRIPGCRRPRKAALSLQRHLGPAEWERSNPCHRHRGIFGRPYYSAATPGRGRAGTWSQTGPSPVAALAEANRQRSV